MTRTTSLSKLIVLTIALAAILAVQSTVYAFNDVEWRGDQTNGNMTNDGNWVGVTPGAGDNITFDNNFSGNMQPVLNITLLVEKIEAEGALVKDVKMTGAGTRDIRLRSENGIGIQNLSDQQLWLAFSGDLRQDNAVNGSSAVTEVRWRTDGSGELIISTGKLTLECDLWLEVKDTSVITIDTAIDGYTAAKGWDITKTGTGTLNLEGDNVVTGLYSFNGGLTVLQGTGTHTVNGNAIVDGASTELRLAAANEIVDTKNVTLSSGGEFNLQGFNETINKLVLENGTVTGTTGILTSTVNVDARKGTIGAILGGAAGLNKTTADTVTLSKINTYTGDTTISEGELKVTGTLLDSDITVNAGAMLSGNGTVDVLDIFGTISPGLSPGLMAAGFTVWNDGGDFEFEIDDTAGSAGADPGWDLLSIIGGLDLSGLTEDGFEIDIISLIHADHSSGDAANFNSASSYAWEFVSTTTGITDFDADDFVLDDSLFTNDLNGGAFSVEQDGDSLEIVFTPIPEPGTIAVLGLGGVGVLLRRRRRKAAA